MAWQVIEATTTIIRDQNGELETEETRIKYRPDSEPEYVKLYLGTILYLKSLPKGYNPILLAFLKRMSYASNGQKIYVNASMKREIASEISSSLSYVNNALTDFVKGKLMFRIDTGTYQFNPQFFGKGEWKDIEKIHTTITFSPEGTDFATEIIKQDKITANKKIITRESSIEELEEAGQTTILEAIQEQTATTDVPTCNECGKVLVERTNGITKEKFMGCPNYKNHAKQKGA